MIWTKTNVFVPVFGHGLIFLVVTMHEIKRTFLKSDGARKVEIFRRADETFGFEELKFEWEEEAWFPVGKYSLAIIDSLDNAVIEARQRVGWLATES